MAGKKAAPQKQQDQEAERDLSAFAAITREMNGAEPNPFSQICLYGSVTQRSTNLGGSQECATLQRALHFKGTKHCQHSRRALVICCALVCRMGTHMVDAVLAPVKSVGTGCGVKIWRWKKMDTVR